MESREYLHDSEIGDGETEIWESEKRLGFQFQLRTKEWELLLGMNKIFLCRKYEEFGLKP